MVTIFENNQNVFSAIEAGATGYILKSDTENLIKNIFDLYNGHRPTSPQIARKIWQRLQQNHCVDTILTTKEKKVLLRRADGETYKRISTEMNISENTVHSHIKSINSKLQATSSQDAINKAKSKGII